jgi:hypothetical protein
VAFFIDLTIKIPSILSEQVLAWWWYPVASDEALDFLHQAMHLVSYCHIAMAVEMVIKVGACCFVCCCPGDRWGNMERVFARWRRPVASGVALDMPHQAMPFVLHRCTAMAIKWPVTEVHLIAVITSFVWSNHG